MMNDGNDAEFFAQLQPRHHKALFSSLSDQEQRAILYHWHFSSHHE